MLFSDIFDFYKKISGKKIAFIGIGVSHGELIRKCAAAGAKVTLCDRRRLEDINEAPELSSLGVSFHTGDGYLENIDADIIFRTPGMYFNNPALSLYRKRGIVVTSEMELFFELCPCKIYAITGSDGKTTTSTVIAKLLEASGKRVHLGGNLGRALLPLCDKISPDDAAVVELSSFQLISMRKSPDVALITNVAPNHLDVHADMNEYIDSKRNIYLHQNGFGRLILNLDNDITNKMDVGARGRVEWFSYSNSAAFEKNPDLCGTYLDRDGNLILKDRDGAHLIMNKKEIKIPGEHNVENYLAAAAVVGSEISPEIIRNVAAAFGGVEHRIELCREKDSVRYYNDSIASSPTRTIAGLNSFNQKVILIAGGYDKHIPYAPLAPKLREKVRLLILMGDTADKIEASLREGGALPQDMRIIRVDTMEEAVNTAHSNAIAGDIVILSPASASFDKYKNFEERGRHFKELVSKL